MIRRCWRPWAASLLVMPVSCFKETDGGDSGGGADESSDDGGSEDGPGDDGSGDDGPGDDGTSADDGTGDDGTTGGAGDTADDGSTTSADTSTTSNGTSGTTGGAAEIVIDFAADLCDAQWIGGSDSCSTAVANCPSPGQNGCFPTILSLTTQTLEDGSTTPAGVPVVIIAPPAGANSVLSGSYPQVVVQGGDRFKTTIACGDSAVGCDMSWQVTYEILGSGMLQLLDSGDERIDGAVNELDIDLQAEGLAGETVGFNLVVITDSPGTADLLYWVAPRIERP